jgi:hypothetical protein
MYVFLLHNEQKPYITNTHKKCTLNKQSNRMQKGIAMQKSFFLIGLFALSSLAQGQFYIDYLQFPRVDEFGKTDVQFADIDERYPVYRASLAEKEGVTREAVQVYNTASSELALQVTQDLLKALRPSMPLREDLLFRNVDGTSSAICFDLHNTPDFTEETGHLLTPHMPTRKATEEIRARVEDVYLGPDKFAMATMLGFLDAYGKKHPSLILRPNRFVILDTTYLNPSLFYHNWDRLLTGAELPVIKASGYNFLVVCETELTGEHREKYERLQRDLGEQLKLIIGSKEACVAQILELYRANCATGK